VRTLRACLSDEPLPRLMAIADLWDAPIEATSASEVARALAEHLLQPENIEAARAALSADAQSALDALVAAGGKMPAGAFSRRFGSIRPMGPGKLERERPWLSPANPAEALWYRGFISRAFDNSSGAPTEAFFVPTDLLAIIAPERPPETTDDRRPTTSIPSSIVHRPSSLLDDITTILCHIQNGEVKINVNGRWHAASRQALTPMLRDANGAQDYHPNGRFAFLLHLIDRLGWVRMQDSRLRLIPQPVASWLQNSPRAQHVALFDAWLNDPEWNDLAHVDGIALEMTHTWSNDPVRERAQIIRMLEEWAARELRMENEELRNAISQFSILNFVACVKSTNPDFARVDGRYDTWHVRDVETGVFLEGFENWDRVEGALIRHLIEKPLKWLEWGMHFAESAHASAEAQPLRVSGDGSVSVHADARFERFQLARIADWVDMREEAYRYRLTPSSLARAKQQGIVAGRAIEFLEQAGGKSIPSNLGKAIIRWSERGAEAKLEPMLLLRTKEAATMDALLQSRAVRAAMVERLSPTCISIRQRDLADVRAAAVESGLLVD
jgi:hypothetical protein